MGDGVRQEEASSSSSTMQEAIEVDGAPLLPRLAFRRSTQSKIKLKLRECIWNLLFFIAPNRLKGQPREVNLSGESSPLFFPPNVVRNTRYNFFTLVPCVLFQQFRFFFNLFYLLVALAQCLPQLRIGPLFTYILPLSMVLFVTVLKEAYDDYQRRARDWEVNSSRVDVWKREEGGWKSTMAASLKVGDLVLLHSDQRVPCDVILLKTTNKTGTTFIRTDQLDGEIDWKLRRAVDLTQSLSHPSEVAGLDAWVSAEAPRKCIYDFVATFYHVSNNFSPPKRRQMLVGRSSSLQDTSIPSSEASRSDYVQELSDSNETPRLERVGSRKLREGAEARGVFPAIDISEERKRKRSSAEIPLFDFPSRSVSGPFIHSGVIADPLGLENVLWASTVVTDGPVWALVIYTGMETRSALNNSSERETKVGLFDLEVNHLSKVLFGILVVAAVLLTAGKGFKGAWVIYFVRFVLLLSNIIPISLRVNLDLAKAFYSFIIARDDKIPNTVVRNSSIPEELGRVDFLLTDKTGTLTQNAMVFRKLHIGKMQFGEESFDEIRDCLLRGDGTRTKRLEIWQLLCRTILGLAVCHNVTPFVSEVTNEMGFQASSPDEVALVKFAAEMGLRLTKRTDINIVLETPEQLELNFNILFCFPFSSEAKRMGCIVQLQSVGQAGSDSSLTPPPEGTQRSCFASLSNDVGRVFFFLKGAETVMLGKVEQRSAHWLQEECDNFARQGLRTLVLAMKELTTQQLDRFRQRYKESQLSLQNRAQKVRAAIDSLETQMTLLGLTGVEDKLQQDVQSTLEAFRHAGIRVWMLTGDKMETATCVAVAAGLKARQHHLLTLSGHDFATPAEMQEVLESFAMGPTESVLALDGPFIELAIKTMPELFVKAACQAPSVICCRCSPTQKESITRAIQKVTSKRTACVGDGGNDVAMIQASTCGIGLVGKEGRQASLAADFSITQFSHLHRLLFWHGRNCYQRSAKLAHFVIHRGLIIATIQVIFSAIFYFIPMAIFQGWLTVGYATYYTMCPVFSLVLDVDLPERVVFMFPELFESLRAGRVMSNKTFFAWLWTSIYQGAVIMLGAMLLFESEFTNILSISFTSLILAELLNVATEISNWHWVMVASQIATVAIYVLSMILLPNYFNLTFIATGIFWWKVATLTIISWLPLYLFKITMKVVQPTRDSKLTF